MIGNENLHIWIKIAYADMIEIHELDLRSSSFEAHTMRGNVGFALVNGNARRRRVGGMRGTPWGVLVAWEWRRVGGNFGEDPVSSAYMEGYR